MRSAHDVEPGIMAQGVGKYVVSVRGTGTAPGMMWMSNPTTTAEDRACLVIIADQRCTGAGFTSAC